MMSGSLRRLSDILGAFLTTAGIIAFAWAVVLWATSPPLVLGVEEKPAVLSTEHGLRPTTEIVVQPTLSSITARDERMSRALSVAYIGGGLLLGAAVCYGSLRAFARLSQDA